MTKHRHQVVPRGLNIVHHEDKVLMIEYSEMKGPRAGWFNFLGGHIEKGEDILDNAEREVQEESGLIVKNTRLVGIVHISGFFDKEIMMFVTVSDAYRSEVVDSYEGTLHRVLPKEIAAKKCFADVPLIYEQVINQHPGECFTAISKYDGQGSLLDFSIR